MKKVFLALILILLTSLCFAYTIKKSDVLKLTSVSIPEISGEYNILPDGYISVPYAGRILVVNKSDVDVVKEIETKLSERIAKPEIYLNVSRITQEVVFVTGRVKNAGSIIITPDTKLATIIAESGDFTSVNNYISNPDNLIVTIKSLDGTKQTVNFSEVLDSNYIPKNGDIINVDYEGLIHVNVVGKVNTPGKYLLTDKHDNIMSAIVMAGGFTPDADYSQVKVYNLLGEGRNVDLSGFTNGTEIQGDISIENNSTIVIPELVSGVTVLGWVKAQGKQIYRPDQTIYLADVIANAGGGITNKARYNEVYVLRNVDGQLVKTSYNFNNFKNKGDITGNPIIKNGDVVYMPCTLQIDWATVLSSLRGLIGVTNDINKL